MVRLHTAQACDDTAVLFDVRLTGLVSVDGYTLSMGKAELASVLRENLIHYIGQIHDDEIAEYIRWKHVDTTGPLEGEKPVVSFHCGSLAK